MQELNISTGLVTYKVNDACEVTINPTDVVFVEKLYDVFEALDEKQEAYKAEINAANKREVFKVARRMDEQLREMVNGVFGFDICTAVFGNMSVCSLADGLPLWANLLLGFMDVVDDSFISEQKKTSARITKYSSKYHK